MSVNGIGPLALELPDSLLDAVAERVAERLAVRKRFHSVESLAVELNMTERQVRGLRERGLPAKRIGKRLVFDMDEVEEWLEQQ